MVKPNEGWKWNSIHIPHTSTEHSCYFSHSFHSTICTSNHWTTFNTHTHRHTHTLSLFLALSLYLSLCLIVLLSPSGPGWLCSGGEALPGAAVAQPRQPYQQHLWAAQPGEGGELLQGGPHGGPRPVRPLYWFTDWLCICEIRSCPLQTWNKWKSPKSASPNYLALRHVLYLESSQYSWNTFFPLFSVNTFKMIHSETLT